MNDIVDYLQSLHEKQHEDCSLGALSEKEKDAERAVQGMKDMNDQCRGEVLTWCNMSGRDWTTWVLQMMGEYSERPPKRQRFAAIVIHIICHQYGTSSTSSCACFDFKQAYKQSSNVYNETGKFEVPGSLDDPNHWAI
eukprot:9848620-Ditylum_brightwellii.AAC.1